MSGTRRRFALAGLVAAVLVGILAHGGVAEPSPLRPDSSATIAEWSPAGVVPAAFRARTWVDGELVSLADVLRGRALGLDPAGLAAVTAGALAWWALANAEGGHAAQRACVRLPGRRAPPVAPA